VDQRVLVIEDSPSVRRLIEVCLRVLDVNVSSAIDGITGLDQIGATDPDVVVLDIGLPPPEGEPGLVRREGSGPHRSRSARDGRPCS